VYDISDDGKRGKIADVCLDYGMDRIQFSAFLGDLAPTHQDELMLKIQSVLGKLPGNVQLFPICEKDWAARRVIDQTASPCGKEAEDRSGAESKDAG
jgi:CRISPR-associated protein Cas2